MAEDNAPATTASDAPALERFMVAIIEPGWDEEAATREDWEQAMRGHNAFAAAVRAAGGTIENSDALGSSKYAVKIRPAADGEPAQFTDGPFTETKEILSGYYTISVRDKEQAKELAALCPTGGWIELYPIIDVTQY